MDTIDNKDQEYFTINVGPQHPSTHGVLRLKMHMSGEEIIRAVPYLGYIHRGIEKISESLGYKQFSYLSSRMDYLSSNINNQCCALAVEKGLQMDIPDRAKVIRTIIAELTRITSHQLWFGSLGLDLGAVSPFFWAFREREIIFEILEETCGTRLTMNYIVPGGVMKDLYPTFVKRVKEVLNQLKDTMHEYDKLLTGNVILQSRLKGVGHISAEDAISYGCSGPIARASGVVCDIRKRHPYEAYDKVEFKEIIRTGGDCFDRYLLRLDEMRESIHIIEQLIDNIPEGSYRENLKGVVKLPAGEYYQRVETARGELGVYITSDGGSKPYRLKYRTPCFSNLGILPPMLKGTKIADMVAIMATLDLIIPDIDR